MSGPVNVIRRHPLISFFVLAYAVAWGFVPFASFGAFGPLVAALIVIPLTRGRAGLREWGSRLIRWRVGWGWYLVALGVPLGAKLATSGIAVAAGGGVAPITLSSVTTFLLVFGLRLINPTDGPVGEEPGWRGFALPGLQTQYSPLLSTAVLALLVAGWHLPLFFLEEGGLQPRILVGGLVTTVAVTFWYAWLFNRTGGSVLIVVIAHSVEGSIQSEGWIYTGVWCAVAIGLLVADRGAWHRPTPADGRSAAVLEGAR